MTNPSLRRRRTVVAAILAIVPTSDQWVQCWAQEIKDVHAGYELASKICSPCHVIGPSPGPSFMDIAKGDYRSAAPLQNLLRSTHSNVSHPGGMPRLDLSDEQIRAISDYIDSFREAR
jgi:mono/diheme cytochrome c family protein